MNRTQILTPAEAKQRIAKYCAYQERCHQEVRDKLYGFGLAKDDVEYLIYELIQHDFLNEERFAIAYVRGKFRHKKWGRNKIRLELNRRKISEYCIKKGMQEINAAEYEQCIVDLLEKKRAKLGEVSYKNNYRSAQYLIGKGFEPELVWETLRLMEK